uniref:ZAD domain-containing protein n=3 Tax=Heliothis virescens TaxID=7102 RepID=A0A2A4K6L6_HELVI
MDSRFHKCRLCLKLGDFCSIFEQDECIKLSDMVMSFTNIQIYEGDGLSDRVCSSCIENLSTAYLFKQQCERIDNLIRKCPETNINKPSVSDYNDFFTKEFHMHDGSMEEYVSAEGDNDQNFFKDNMDSNSSIFHEISDETDSDVDSIKCGGCNESYSKLGTHTCRTTCTIEQNQLQRSSSNETLVASDVVVNEQPVRATQSLPPRATQPLPDIPEDMDVTCVLCDEKFDQYDNYVIHFNRCTTNVKLHHYVCPVCHDIYTEKLAYLEHLKAEHFKVTSKETVVHYKAGFIDPGEDCVDFVPSLEKTRKPKTVRRQIGWSVEDIYQEIDCKKVEEKQTPTSSPFKTFLSKLGNETFSRQSTPKKVSFRKLIESGKEKTANYLPFQKYIQNYKLKKKASSYSPIKGKMQVSTKIKASLSEMTSDSDYHSPSGTSEESWKLKQNLICACEKKVFMLSESINNRERIAAMINELGGVVAENTKMEMLATHFVAVLPDDTFTGMMVCALATGKWLIHVNFIYDSFRCKKFLQEYLYEWLKHPKILEIDTTSVEVAKAAVFWHLELDALSAKFPFEGKQIVLIMKRKYRQYYQMIFKTLKAKPVTYDPRTPGSCCTADYCFVDMKIIERVKLRFFARHNVPVFPYQYILVFLLKRGQVEDEYKYLLQDCKKYAKDTMFLLNDTY